MTRQWLEVSGALLLSAWLAAAQGANAQDMTFQVPATQAWTDTGIDLQASDTLILSAMPAATSAGASGLPACDPKGVSGSVAASTGLPLPGAPAGALIARLHAHGALPVLIGAGREVHVQEASHLFLGMNLATGQCEGSITVTVHKVASGAEPSTVPAEESAGEPQTRGGQMKSQLSAAAKIFMSGQFGDSKSEATTSSSSVLPSGDTTGSTPASTTATLKISDVQLDPGLRKSIDGLPRRVNDQFQNQGDMVNFVIVGSQKDVQAALDAASWHVADTNNEKAVLNAVLNTYDKKDYLQMPMSTLYLFGRRQDFGYEMAEPIAMVASRHHFRIWKAPFTWNGSEAWVGAGTHDIGFAKDKRNNDVTHKIDPAVDGERDNIGSSLQKSGKTKSLNYYLPPNPVQDAKNATGDGYHSDGRLLVIVVQ